MKNFIKLIREKDKELVKSYAGKELHNIEKVLADLEEEHTRLRDDLKEVNYLLDLIKKHEIKASPDPGDIQRKEKRKTWLESIRSGIENFHLMHTESLSDKDIAYLSREKNRLKLEKDQLEEQHKHLNTLIAKTRVFLMNTRNDITKELTGGYTIAEVGEKLLENFGTSLKEETTYEDGRNTLRKFLEKTFSLDRIKSKLLFDILEKSKLLFYKINTSEVFTYPSYVDFNDFTDVSYIPLFGTWHINA